MKKIIPILCSLCIFISCIEEDNVENQEILAQADLRILLIGSSYGANSIMQFPILARAGGINIGAGNFFQGSVSLGAIAEYCQDNVQLKGTWYHIYKDSLWTNQKQTTMKNILKNEKWDVVIIQRSATEAHRQPYLELKKVYGSLTVQEQNELDSLQTHAIDNWVANINTITNYINQNCAKRPQILFNVTWADANAYRYFISAKGKEREEHGLEKMQYVTDYLWNSAKEIKARTGINLIPCAPIVQEVRNNEKYQKMGSWNCTVTQGDGTVYTYSDDNKMLTDDCQHLDAGVGCYIPGCVLYETILKSRNKHISANTYLPTLKDVGIQKFAMEANKNPHTFTSIPEDYAKAVREIVSNWFAKNQN